MKTNKLLVMAILGIFIVVAFVATASYLVQASTQDEIIFAEHIITEDQNYVDASIVDLNGDGLLDIVAVQSGPTSMYIGELLWWQNDGTPVDGGWTLRVITDYIQDARSLYVTDLDADSNLDILVAGASQTAWWENDGSPEDGGWIKHTIDDVLDTTDVIAADLDGDNDLDVIVAAYYADAFIWWESDGTPADGGWTQHLIAESLDGVRAVVAADLNNDTHLDIVGAVSGNITLGDGRIAWWQSDGTPADGGWTYHLLAANFALASDVHVTDLDEDYDLDILAVGYQMDEFTWWEYTGGTNFIQHTLTGDFTYVQSVSTGDVDGDGDIDVFASSSSEGLAWWENDGHESFTRYIFDSTNGWMSVDAADIDEDEDLDLLTASFSSPPLAWWEQGGYVPPPPSFVYLPVILDALPPTPTPTQPPVCSDIRVGQWAGDVSFTVPEDQTRVLNFAYYIETNCGSGWIIVPEIYLTDCMIIQNIILGEHEEIDIYGDFVSETELEGHATHYINYQACIDYWDAYWISSKTGK